ncbi:MAG: NADPH dehydrogenase NamA [Tissierellaceae bacterium]
MKSLTEFKIKNMTLKNRIVMPPMCMYSAEEDGFVKDFHRIHYGSRAIGGAGLIIVEATAVVPNGRLTSNDLGIWSDDHIQGLKSLVDGVKAHGSKIALQLGHGGRKSASNDEYIVAPSPISYSPDYRMPRELTLDEIKDLVSSYREAARRANEAGFDAIEVHGAHGYLVHEFLSPLTNKRRDQYGGSLENRTRFLNEILSSIKEIWPEEKPIIVRVTADDYLEGGIDKEEIVRIVNEVKSNIDLVHVSTGGLVNVKFDIFPGYQVSYAEAIKNQCDIATIAVGLIDEYRQIEEILYNERADLVAVGRGFLRDPYFVLNMAHSQGIKMDYPLPYERAYR